MRQFLAACLLGLQSFVAAGAAPVDPAPDLAVLAASAGDADPATVTGAALDGQLRAAAVYAAKNSGRNQVHVALPAAA